MSEGTVRDLLAEAEQAASTGDLAAAERLLSDAARHQESELGPLHPDLAYTLNNLAIVAEKTGQTHAAESYYRRAVAIASASLAPDDPTLVASRQNLEDFCRAHGVPIDPPAVEPRAEEPRAEEPLAEEPTAPAAPTASPAPPPVSRKSSRASAAAVIGMIALVVAGVLIARSWPRHDTPPPPSAPAASPVPESKSPQPTADARVERQPEAKVAPTSPPPRRSAVSSVVTAELCRSFSAQDWRCTPAGDSVAPGPIIFYTRVRSPRDGVVVHRWYRGETLVRSVQLKIAANATDGYRTYSRQTVDRGEWRVELRSAAGDLLHEQRLTVR